MACSNPYAYLYIMYVYYMHTNKHTNSETDEWFTVLKCNMHLCHEIQWLGAVSYLIYATDTKIMTRFNGTIWWWSERKKKNPSRIKERKKECTYVCMCKCMMSEQEPRADEENHKLRMAYIEPNWRMVDAVIEKFPTFIRKYTFF